MFVDFYLALRRRGVPATVQEWLVLQDALDRDLASSLQRFYFLARSILVKSEAQFDRYDLAFLDCFGGIESTEELVRLAEEELARLSPDLAREGAAAETFELDEVERRFLGQLRARNFRGHEGGSRAIGVRGTSTQGAGGSNPAGVRVGQGAGRMRSAVKIAEARAFENYRDDVVLDTRALKVALSHLRQAARDGPRDELDLGGTIDRTCRNAGELELVWERNRRKKIRLLLLMDAGGTMAPHAHVVSQLFSAARDVVRELRSYYFHNCVYQDLYTDIAQRKSIPTRKVLEGTDRSFKVVVVGDASMAPSELFSPNGAIDYWYRNDRPGIEWLADIRNRFRKAIWLNPEPKRWWPAAPTTEAIRKIFPMFELTLAGVRSGVRALLR